MKSRKPKITLRCVANHYSAPNETIAEITAPNGKGCLLSVTFKDDGTLQIHAYREDSGVYIVPSAATQPGARSA